MKLAYVSVRYRAPTRQEVELNIAKARAVAISLIKRGFMAYCPHTNTKDWDVDGVPDALILQGDLEVLGRCDFLVMLPGWEHSVGALLERSTALRIGKKVYDSLEMALEKEVNEHGNKS